MNRVVNFFDQEPPLPATAPDEPPPADEADYGNIVHIRGERVDASASTLPLVWFADIQPILDAQDFVQGVLVDGSAAVIYGESNTGKTFWTTDLALHVAAGQSWNGRRVEMGGVIYCVLEGGRSFRNRVAAWRAEKALEAYSLPFAAIPAAINLLHPDADTPRLIAAVKEASAKIDQPVRLIVIDTLSRAMAGGNENAPDDMGALVSNMDRLRAETGACVVFIHHSGKDAAKGARGHSLLRAAVDTEIEVAVGEGEAKTAVVSKQRELQKGDAFGFQLRVVELGENRHGEKVTTCIVEPANGPVVRGTKRDRLSATANIGLRALTIAMSKSGAHLPPLPEYPADTAAVTETTWRDEFYQLKGSNGDANKHAFSRARDALLAADIITQRNGFVWFVGAAHNGTQRDN